MATLRNHHLIGGNFHTHFVIQSTAHGLMWSTKAKRFVSFMGAEYSVYRTVKHAMMAIRRTKTLRGRHDLRVHTTEKSVELAHEMGIL